MAANSSINKFEILGQPLEIAEDSSQADSLLVRFRDDAFCVTAGDGCSQSDYTSSLPGRWRANGLSSISGLREVQLRSDADVDNALAAYRAHPDVLYAEPNYRITATQVPNDPRYIQLWGLDNIGQTGGTLDVDIDAPEAWDVTVGGDTVVAVIDTGVDYLHEDLADNMWVNPGEIPNDGFDNDGNGFIDDVHGYDFANNDGNPMDDHGHGTHTAGTIGAVGNNGIGITGVNWTAQIMAVKFLDSFGSGTTANAIRAINYATQMGAKISNNSWGDNETLSNALYDAVANAGSAGQLFVAAAGNGNILGFGQDNDQLPFYPASFDLDNVISVAATNQHEERAIFSNFGAMSVDLAAPGVNVMSTAPNNLYEAKSGTSMAAPHVAGVAALVAAQHPEWSYADIAAQILGTVDPVPSMDGITVTGGRLNAASALGNPAPVPPPPPPPQFGTLPILEDFEDGEAEYFQIRGGAWRITNGRYEATPLGDAIATVRVADSLPQDLSVQATLNADPVIGSLFSNAFVIFDYENDTSFKFAGAKFETDEWVIGHRTTASWVVDASLYEPISPAIDYRVEVAIEDDRSVTLFVNGAQTTTFDFDTSLIDGRVGVGTWNAQAQFDDVVVEPYTPPTPPPFGNLPLIEDFDDKVADYFRIESGSWSAFTGRYRVTPVGDSISIAQVSDPLPDNFEIRGTMNADAASGSYYGNSFLIFDYQGPLDFKFAGQLLSTGKWTIGHRNPTTWVRDIEVPGAITPGTDYDVQVAVEDDTDVILFVDGSQVASYSFGGSLSDGEVGLGTWNAFASFDDVTVASYTPPPDSLATFPMAESFDNGLPGYFDLHTGIWSVIAEELFADGQGSAIATIRLANPLPNAFEVLSTARAESAGGGLYSNAFVIFDYQSDTDFKFAGALIGSGKWGIGRKNGSNWIVDAEFLEPVSANVDYQLNAVIENSNISLLVNGIAKVSHTFNDDLFDGEVGVATWNANGWFDDFGIQDYVPPPSPPGASLPLSEDFDDGQADFFSPATGGWSVAIGRYLATASGDAISILNITDPIPSNVEMSAIVNSEPAAGGLYSNAYLVFDYQSPTDFKFAGASIGAGKWAIGHRTGNKWVTDASYSGSIDANADYQVKVQLDGQTATILVDDVPQTSFAFADLLNDGDLGLATWNANSEFDDVVVDTYSPPPPPPAATLPVWEDFDDGVADFFDQRTGVWEINSGRYDATPNGDAIATLRTNQGLPSDFDLEAIVNAAPISGSYYSNGYLVFDYQGPTDFKFAGAALGANKWSIGRRSGSKWITDRSYVESISDSVDYGLRVEIRDDSSVTLFVNDVAKVAHTYSAPLSDGQVGMATWNAFATFDDFSLEQPVGISASSLALLGGIVATDSSGAGEADADPGFTIDTAVLPVQAKLLQRISTLERYTDAFFDDYDKKPTPKFDHYETIDDELLTKLV